MATPAKRKHRKVVYVQDEERGSAGPEVAASPKRRICGRADAACRRSEAGVVPGRRYPAFLLRARPTRGARRRARDPFARSPPSFALDASRVLRPVEERRFELATIGIGILVGIAVANGLPDDRPAVLGVVLALWCRFSSREARWVVPAVSVTIDLPPHGTAIGDDYPQISGSGKDGPGMSSCRCLTPTPLSLPASSVTCLFRWLRLPNDNPGGQLILDRSSLIAPAQGLYTVLTADTNVASNAGEIAPHSFTVDTAAPTASLVDPGTSPAAGRLPWSTLPRSLRAPAWTPAPISTSRQMLITGTTILAPLSKRQPRCDGGIWSLDLAALRGGPYTVSQARLTRPNAGESAPGFTSTSPRLTVTITSPAGSALLNDATPPHSRAR